VLQPPLQPLHSDESLNKIKLAQLERLTTEVLGSSLMPGQPNCLKARLDGTLLEGHHRIYILRTRGVDVDSLEREIVVKPETQA
jgi:hypothetical protein